VEVKVATARGIEALRELSMLERWKKSSQRLAPHSDSRQIFKLMLKSAGRLKIMKIFDQEKDDLGLLVSPFERIGFGQSSPR
jgi:hypothetical protein